MKIQTPGFTITIIGRRAAMALAVLGLAAGFWAIRRNAGQHAAPPLTPAVAAAGAATVHSSFLHGRVTTVNGATYTGRLRFGGDEEAFWGDYFNGVKRGNPWAEFVPRSARRTADGRPVMARFGDITRIEADGRHLWVTLKSGLRYHLNRYAADDFADGVRVWDERGEVFTLNERRVRMIEFFPGNGAGAATPARLHGTVRTRAGDFPGLIQWRGRDSSGMYVDDARFGRVLVSREAIIGVDAGKDTSSGPAYTDYPVGTPIAGTVTTFGGRTLTGRLVFDLDESQSTETLDAPSGGVDYTIPFAMIASIVLPASSEPATQRVSVALRNGVALQLERGGDLGRWNAGMLIFAAGGGQPEYVPWAEVQRLDFD
jgi:hypothetical protein